MTNAEWFKQAGFGLMVHFGLYSMVSGEWKGRRIGGYAPEWVMSHCRIPIAEYSRLAEAFNPILFSADQWIQTAKDAGMQYLVVTSKHHDGFALFNSEYDDYNVVKATPFGRDIIGELAEACYKHGLKLGLYYSQEQDWHEPHGGGYLPELTLAQNGVCSWTNDWDFPDNEHKDYSICYEGKIKAQVKEILTKYGDLAMIWFDNPKVITPEQSAELVAMVKHYQPDCLVNSRIGNGLGDIKSFNDNVVTDEFMLDGLYETPITLNNSWGYRAHDQNWKDAKAVIELKEHLNRRGVNLLLNVGPDGLGRFPAPAVQILREVGSTAK